MPGLQAKGRTKIPFTYYLENKLIDHANGKTSYSMPTVYVGLSSTTPAKDGTNVTEPSGGNYARVATAGADWNAASNGSSTNANVITFLTANANWLTSVNLTYAVLYDSSSGGNLLSYGALTQLKPVLNGDTPSFIAGQIIISLV